MTQAPARVLITGGCGYIGSHVAQLFAAKGERVAVIDNLSTGFRDSLQANEAFYEGDVGDAALLDRVFNEHPIEAILHFAAALVVPESVAEPLRYYQNNTLNTLGLLRKATAQKVKHFVFSSTAATYGTPQRVPAVETDPTVPESPYGWSKLMSERMLIDTAAATGLGYAILRYFNVAGADPEARIGQRSRQATHLVKIACEAAVGKRKRMTIFGTDYPTPDGTCVRDYVHVVDLAHAHWDALSYLRRGGASTVANCCYGRGYSVKEVVTAVQKVTGVDFPIDYGPRRAGDPAAIYASSDRLRQLTGWTPQYADLETIVRHAFAWEKKLPVNGI